MTLTVEQGHSATDLKQEQHRSKKVFASLYQYKVWANSEPFALLQAVETSHPKGLPLAVRMFNRIFIPKGMHLAARILDHVFVVDQIFKANLAGEKHPLSFPAQRNAGIAAALRPGA